MSMKTIHEQEFEQMKRKCRNHVIKTSQKMDDTFLTLENFIDTYATHDKEIVDAFHTIYTKYVLWSLEHKLLIKDPNIVFEVLKDDK